MMDSSLGFIIRKSNKMQNKGIVNDKVKGE